MEFAKAVLEEVGDGPGTQTASGGARITVQINPATLRLQMASTVDFGKDTGRQKVQYQGSTSTLSVRFRVSASTSFTACIISFRSACACRASSSRSTI